MKRRQRKNEQDYFNRKPGERPGDFVTIERDDMEYKYGMRLRGFSPGCQPMNGFVRREDDITGTYHDIIVYNRPLTAEERKQYELDDMTEAEK